MTTDLEADLCREFDAARPPSTLTFSRDSVLRQGSRTIRRRRIMASGSAVVAVGLIAVGTTLMSRPHISAAPLPATRTATTGIVQAQTGHLWGGQSEVRFNRDPAVQSNVRYSIVGKDGLRHELGVSSTGTPGQKPTAVWKSGMVDGHPVTIGVFPGHVFDSPTVTFANGISYPVGVEELRGTGYMMFYVDYTMLAIEGEPRRPSEIASIRWSGPSGVIDGVEGDHRLTGWVLALSDTVSVDVVVRPADGGRSTVFGQSFLRDKGFGYGHFLSTATTDPAGVAVVTSRAPTIRTVKGLRVGGAGALLAAGVLPPGATGISVIRTSGAKATGRAVQQLLPDGRVIFAITPESLLAVDPGKDLISAVTWTNYDGTPARKDVRQKQG